MRLYAAKFTEEVRPNVTRRIFLTLLIHGGYAIYERHVTELSTFDGSNRVVMVKKEKQEIAADVAQLMLLSGRFTQITNNLWVHGQLLTKLMQAPIPLIDESPITE